MASIAVITPYHQEPLEVLEQCHRSVLAQEPAADHFMVADGFPNPQVAGWKVRHVVLPQAHGYGGSVPRGVGAMLAEAQGYEFVAFLDADNWYHPGHLASLVELQRRTRAPVCSSLRTFHQPDGTPIETVEAAEDQLVHVDTSCLLIHRSAFSALPVWMHLPQQIFKLCDRVFVAALRHKRFAIASTRQRTVAYRTLYQTHYEAAGLPLPAGFKPTNILHPSYEWLNTREGVALTVERLGFWPAAYMA
ncbi:glycosyltransferase [Ramlibacter humi]|uniref:Glycosyltransferase family 2 protein n=1 Tax=Ramlibacter humi TaxID=2530451 RepID=A0A4Z0C932_9BURK|nr:glycosyltransferase [Ramlibacter humi]TFZ08187.1 glycosyltransferase family 2 protein [Ramlibacter humi]